MKHMFQPLICKLPKATCLISVEHSGEGRKEKKKRVMKREEKSNGGEKSKKRDEKGLKL